ncbi:MAG: acetylxylan esterase [Bryobacteraceae bacterium]
MLRFCLLLVVCASVWAQSAADALSRKILDPNEPLLDVQVYTASKVPVVPAFLRWQEWDTYSARLRQRVLDEVIYRGEARRWRDAKLGVKILEPFHSGRGYKVRQFLFEAIPGLWVPGLIYEPERVTGRVPLVLNVNGHEGNGTQTAYIQARCINLAKKGIIAVNPEWLGKGQLNTKGLDHYHMPQIDLMGTSGVAVFYQSLKRSLDVALSLPNADPAQVAVTGLSGGGWQTIFLSALDTRVALASPVAGYSSYVTRAQWPELDLGDSEQTPSDLASVADYAHLTALMAPRGLQLAYNAKDNCCFRADYSFSPLIQMATPVYRMYNAPQHLRYHINHGNGHNYDADNREAFYRLLRDHFGLNIDVKDENVDSELRQEAALRPQLPENNLDFHQIATQLMQGLPRPLRAGISPQAALAQVVRYQTLPIEAFAKEGGDWKLRMGRAWSIPLTEISPANPSGTVLLVADAGRASLAAAAQSLVAEGKRVVAMDPFYFGESKIAKRDFLFAMLLAGIGERPLGLQASQIAATARWLDKDRKFGPVEVRSTGPRTSLGALIAAALEKQSIKALAMTDSMASLKEIVEKDWTVDKYPEMFCFGLYEAFDIPLIEAMVKPRPVQR